jgi:hypothetical protein
MLKTLGAAPGAPSAATAAPADVNRVWSGALVGGAPVTMNLKNGPEVRGDLSVGGHELRRAR